MPKAAREEVVGKGGKQQGGGGGEDSSGGAGGGGNSRGIRFADSPAVSQGRIQWGEDVGRRVGKR